MTKNKMRLRYLPMFYEDMAEKVSYIAHKLKNSQAANTLIDDIEKAILKRLQAAESFEPFYSLKERTYPYYRIYVKSYVIYYVVIEDDNEGKVMEVRRFLYNKQNRDEVI